MTDYTELRALFAEHHAALRVCVDSLKPDSNGFYSCPLCNGEGSIDAEDVACGEAFDRELLEKAGLQVFGFGQSHIAVARLLRLLLEQVPTLLDELDGCRAFERTVHEALNSGDGSYRP